MKSGLSFISFTGKEFHMMFADKAYLTLGKVMSLTSNFIIYYVKTIIIII